MNDTKTASVIIPTYNRLDLLTQTLRSIVDSSTPATDIDVVIVDDGSSDETFRAVRTFEGDLNLKYVFQPDKGFRVSRAKNLGLSVSEGDVCICIDSGIVIPTWFISAHLTAHQESGPAVVLGNILGFDYNDKNTAMLTDEMDGRRIDDLVRDWENRDALADPREPAWDQCGGDLMQLPAPWALAWTANVSFHRALLGPDVRFDETYQSWGAEDQDFALSLYNEGLDLSSAVPQQQFICPIRSPNPTTICRC